MKLGFIRQCEIVLIAFALIVSGCSKGTDAAQAGVDDAKGQTPGKKGGGQGRGGPGGGGGAGRGGDGGGGGGRGQSISGVKLVPVERMAFQREVDLSGTLLSQDQVRISSEVDGVVKDVLIEIGQEVKAGQVIVQIDTRELQFALERAESALRQTEAQIGISGDNVPADDQIASVRTAMANRDDAKAQLARAQELSGKGLMSKSDLDTAQTRVKVTEAQYGTALDNVHATKASLQDRRAAFELAKKKLTDAQIKTPVTGVVSERLAQRGEFLRANTQVATVVQLSSLKLKSAVQEKYATRIRPGLAVKFAVESYPGETFVGKIAYISPSIDQATRTFPVEVLVENGSRKLRPGFFAKGTILTQKDEGVLAVPEEAVVMLAGVPSVYVVKQGTAQQTNIKVGEREGTYLEVTGGLQGNEMLAASNLNQLVSGMQVNGGGGGGRGRGNRGGDGTAPAVSPDGGGAAPAADNVPTPDPAAKRGGRGGRGNRGGGEQRGSNQGGGSQ